VKTVPSSVLSVRFFAGAMIGVSLLLVAASARAQMESDEAPNPGAESDTTNAKPAAKAKKRAAVTAPADEGNKGFASEAGTPGWMVPSLYNDVAFEWHGNIELDAGQVRYSWDKDSLRPETVYDARGRFVLGPMVFHNFDNGLFFRATGQLVAWVREDYRLYQGNADDVYAQFGKKGLWDVMFGRFLTWRVFRKGLAFDLYTLEDTGARTQPNFSDPNGSMEHVYEVSTIFMRDSFGSNPVPGGRAAFHLYPADALGFEAVVAYGRLASGGNVVGGRLAGGIKLPFVNALGAVEYVTWTPAQQLSLPDPDTGLPKDCGTCGKSNVLGFGGSIQLAPVPWFDVTADFARRSAESWNPQNNIYNKVDTLSWGGNFQFDFGSFFLDRSLAVGGGFFRTEKVDQYDLWEQHNQMAGFLAYALGFNGAVVKLVVSRATGDHEEKGVNVNGDMFSVRLRVACYF